MPSERSTRSLDVVTAVMLGLVSVVTALGAWQAAAWDSRAQEFERDAGDARDVSVNQSVLADYSRRTDLEASATAKALSEQRAQETDLFEQLVLDNRIQAALSATTPGFSDAWFEWQAGGSDPLAQPIDDPDYVVARDGVPQAYGYTGAVLDDLSQRLQNRSSVLAQAALIQALALFLFGIAGVNRLRSVRIAVLVLGLVTFAAGVLFGLTAFGAGA